jgi:hypothetical protein
MTTQIKRKPPTVEQVLAEQDRMAEKEHAAVQAKLPAKPAPTAIADPRDHHQAWLDEIAPKSIVGRGIKFTKENVFATTDDKTVIEEDTDFVALCDQLLVGWVKFNGEGNSGRLPRSGIGA